MTYTLLTDGACTGMATSNTAMSYGFVLKEDDKPILQGRGFLGPGTSIKAEYRAIIEGLAAAKTHGVTSLELRSDSQTVIRQLRGEYAVRQADLAPLYKEVMGLIEGIRVTLTWVPRKETLEADRLSQIAMQTREEKWRA